MKNLTKIAGIMIPIVSLVCGCSSNTGAEVELAFRVGHKNAVFRETDDRTKTDKTMLKEDAQPYFGVKKTALFDHYQEAH